jgi:hypothetical protein
MVPMEVFMLGVSICGSSYLSIQQLIKFNLHCGTSNGTSTKQYY